MISKELLSEVLELEDDIISIDLKGNTVIWVAGVPFETTMMPSCTGAINIYELAHKCKEWAFLNDFEIVTRMRIPDIYRDEHKIDYGYEINHTNNGAVESSWWLSTEPEAIFKACGYILNKLEIFKAKDN